MAKIIHIWIFSVASVLAIEALAVTLNPGDIVVSDHADITIHIDPITGTQTVITSGGIFGSPHTIVIDSSGDLIIADPQAAGMTGAIIRVDPSTGSQSIVSSSGFFADPAGIVIDAAGDYIVTDRRYGGTGAVIRVNPNTGAQTIISSGGVFLYPIGITIDSAGDFIIADHSLFVPGKIVKVDHVTGTQSVLFDGGYLDRPTAVAISENGDFFVSEATGSIIQIDGVTGSQSILASGGYLTNPQGIALDADDNILVLDELALGGDGALIRIDPISGIQTLVSSGDNFLSPIAVIVVPHTMLDPADAIVELVGEVMDLNLQHGIANSLDAKLEAIFQALDDANENNDGSVVNTLYAFINAVQAQSGKKIPAADAIVLTDAAQAIIDQLLM